MGACVWEGKDLVRLTWFCIKFKCEAMVAAAMGVTRE